MKTTSKLILTAAVALLAVACGKKQTKSGLEYILNKDVEGKNIKFGDFIIFNFKVYNHKDSLLQDSYERGMPIATKVDTAKMNYRLNEAFTTASEGDSLTVFESVDSIIKARPGSELMPGVTKGTKLKYVFKILNVYDASKEADFNKKYSELQQVAFQKMQKKMEAEAAEGLKAEPAKIEAYLKKNAGYEKTAEGYYLKKVKTTSGVQPKAGEKVRVHYTGTLLDGKKFDSSLDRNEPFMFEVGKGLVIPGWDLVVAQMKVGEKVQVVLPSSLAYGARQAGPDIKPHSPLYFDIELLEIAK